jgi:hypothetical protein
MIGPGRDGRDPFARFLAGAAVYRDMAQLPPFLQRPATLAHLANAPHDTACVVQVLNDLLLAMVQTAEVPAPR